MGALTEAQRGVLLSTMSTETAAVMLGRSEGWVCRQRAAMIDLPPVLPVQARAARAAKPWRPDDDAFAPPVVARRPIEARAQTWREAGEAAVRQVAVTSPAVCSPPELAAGPAPSARRWNDLRRAEGASCAAALPPDPAILSEKHHERMFVRTKRAAGVSWFNIANMTGRTVPYLQAQYGEGKL